MQPIPSLFTSQAKCLPGASVTSQEPVSPNAGVSRPALPLTVKTAPEQWAYAARFDRAQHSEDDNSPILVRVVMKVTTGALGVGCLNTSKTAFIDEQIVGSTSSPAIVELVVKDRSELGSLIVRNGATGQSEAHISEIRCFALAPAADDVRQPGLSDPQPISRWNRYYGIHGATILDKLRVQTFSALAHPVVLRWVDGSAVRIFPGDQLSRALFVSGTYEPNTLCVLRRLLHSGDVFFDLGANAGVLSLAASRWVGASGHVYAFEPSEREFARLVDNCALSGVTNITPIRAAVRSQSGPATLRVASSAHGGLNTLGERFAYDGVETLRLETVDGVTLDDFVERERIAKVAVIKIDVEGSEGAVLAGCTRVLREHRPPLIVEVFARALAANAWNVSDLERLLRDASYRLFSLDDDSAGLTPVAHLADMGEQNVIALPEEMANRYRS